MPVILAVCFLMVVAWTGGELRLWFIIPPLTILGALQLAVAIRALQPARVSVWSLAILGVVELAIGIFVLAATSPLTSGAVTGGVIALIAAVISFAAAFRMRPGRRRGRAARRVRDLDLGPRAGEGAERSAARRQW